MRRPVVDTEEEDRRTLKSLQLDPTSGCKQRNTVRIREAENSLVPPPPHCGDTVRHEFWKETLLLSFPPELHKLLNRLAQQGK